MLKTLQLTEVIKLQLTCIGRPRCRCSRCRTAGPGGCWMPGSLPLLQPPPLPPQQTQWCALRTPGVHCGSRTPARVGRSLSACSALASGPCGTNPSPRWWRTHGNAVAGTHPTPPGYHVTRRILAARCSGPAGDRSCRAWH